MSGCTDITAIHRQKTATSPEISEYTDVCFVADISVFCWYQRCYVTCRTAAPPGPGLWSHWPLPSGSNRSSLSLMVLRPFGGSVHRWDTPDTLVSCTFLVGWLSLTDCKPESRFRRQTSSCQWNLKLPECRNNLNVILDLSTSCVSQCDSHLWPTASAVARGQEFATSVQPAGARLLVLWIRVMTAPILGPSTCTVKLHARVPANVCAREFKRQLDEATPLQGI